MISTPRIVKKDHSQLVEEELLRRIACEDGGSVFVCGSGLPAGWIAALTNHPVRGDLGSAVRRMRRFAMEFISLNPLVAPLLTIGWERPRSGDLILDLGVALPAGGEALTVANVFKQERVAFVNGERVEILDVNVPVPPRHGLEAPR